MSDPAGRTLGSCKIQSEIGHGGMANVYRAVQPSIGREVAIKVLPTHLLQDRSFLERFNREVQVIAKLKHPRILPVIDYGEQDGSPYIVMAYMEGGTLADWINQSPGGLPLDEVTRLVSQIAEGLDYAHKRGVIHRDFKPSNVLLDTEGNAHLADFGIAKLSGDPSQLTGSGLIGTPAYMAPEMSKAGAASPLADIYSLGVTLYEMLTGQRPFQGDTPISMMMAHASAPVPDVTAIRPDLPPSVQAVLHRALAKNPPARYQTAAALAADLTKAASGGHIVDDASTQAVYETPRSARMLTIGRRGRIPLWGWIASVSGLTALVLLLLAVIRLDAMSAEKSKAEGQTATALAGAAATAQPTGVASTTPTPPGYVSPTPSSQILRVLEGHTGFVYSVAFSPDGAMLASASGDKTIILWDVAGGQQLVKLTGHHKEAVNSIAFSPTRPQFASASADASIIVWDARNTRQIQTLTGHTAAINSIAFSPDGALLASAANDATVILWDAETFQPIRTLSGHVGGIMDIAFSPDGSLLASAGLDQTLRVWDVQTGRQLYSVQTSIRVYAFAISPDGETIAVGTDKRIITLLDMPTGASLSSFDTGQARGNGLSNVMAFAPDRPTLLAFGEEEGLIALRDIRTGATVELEGHRNLVSCVAWSPDGKILASGGYDNVVILWNVESGG